jgi:hypothetical protein
MIRIAVDPGKHSAAFSAFYQPSDTLLHAELVTLDGYQVCRPDLVARIFELKLHVLFPDMEFLEAVVEIPKPYATAKQSGDQRDIRDVALVAGALMFVLFKKSAAVRSVEPWEWKGQIPKSVTKSRVDRELTPDEVSRILWPKQAGKRHNVYDAIHMGLREFTTRNA